MKRFASSVLSWLSACIMVLGFSACTLDQGSGKNNYVLTGHDASRFIESIRAYQGNAESHYEMGCYLQERKKHKPAIAEFKSALAIDPKHVKALNGLGVSYDATGDYDRAVESYKEALKTDEKLDYVLNNLGYSYLLQDRTDLAVENFKKALELDDGNARYRNNLALAYAKSERYDAALGELKKSGDEAKAHYLIAQMYYGEGLYEEAEAHFEQASLLKVFNVEIERGLKAASSLAEIVPKDWPIAKEVGETAVHTKPKPRVTQAGNKLREGASEEAQKILEQEKPGFYDEERALNLSRLQIADVEKELGSGLNIEVSNGNGVRHMARDVGNYLHGMGFIPKYLRNARHFRYEQTKIYYATGYLREAYLLADILPGWQSLEEVAEIRDGKAGISILIGKDLAPHLDFFTNRQNTSAFSLKATNSRAL